MTLHEALPILIDMASRYGENFEEGFTRRVTADTTDEECATIAGDDYGTDEVIEIRDLWRAIKVANAAIAKESHP